ncbi:hypothetical protein SAMD00019534_092330 [Acytostelium subglobosum LB1]|uniref:hypothetical protein n=1 Tax=Acytostelium subglobosum LB1 TaxID=1410327 RepID=UPI0006449EB6|nr:hypothetical protein SAMD00019534_092330 [Acytostelium subglobosum LB1]GAM26058.1 hypothetical protein SAMD00019534_092330 [Acytostelium subglobosum LB1]|eukprot:XP_012751101.1 hypothetical protein SAMD00019534_092330 [Acytostelium subglobosum LB1]
MSIYLIERLNASPLIKYEPDDDCLIQALKSGDKDMIEHCFTELSERTLNYRLESAFREAMELGNVSIARRLMALWPKMNVTGSHIVLLLESLGRHASEVTESTIIEILILVPEPSYNEADIIRAASNISLSMIKLVVDHFNSMPKNDVDRMKATDFRKSIDLCAKRCDVQSIDYLIDVAINVDGKNPPANIGSGSVRVTRVRYGWDQHRIHDIITLDVITNSSVLTYFMDKGYINVSDDNDKFNSNALYTIVNKACVKMSSINVQYQQSSEQQPSQNDLLYV